ncbi:MAG: peptide chain release factor 2 [Candidatus Magasanikbacteria bacterium]
MSEEKNLEQLKQKVDSTYDLVDVEQKKEKKKELEQEMSQEDFWQDQQRAKKIKKEHSKLEEKINIWEELKGEVQELQELKQELQDEENESLQKDLRNRTEELWQKYDKLELELFLDGKFDDKNAIVSINSGSGGVEAQDWAEMLLRMILRYSEDQGWSTTVVERTEGKEAGIKSASILVEGEYAYGKLKSEDGTHRLVRLSPFDADNSRHTSFALIEVIPELKRKEGVELKEKDLEIDTFMSSKPGGQSVNRTESAVRITHEPTGITVSCQNEKSQKRNKETAKKILRSKLEKYKQEKQEEKLEEIKGEYKSPEWGNQIRSYVLHPYNMVKDLRTEHESSDPESVLEGEIGEFVEAYLRYQKEN